MEKFTLFRKNIPLFFLLFFLYTLLGAYLLIRIPFVRRSGLRPRTLLGLFGIKLGACIAYGWFFHSGLKTTIPDTWSLFQDSLLSYQALIHHPIQFVHQSALYLSQFRAVNPLGTRHSFLGQAGRKAMVLELTLFNLLSGGRYFIDCILFSWLTLLGTLAWFRLSRVYFPDIPTGILLIAVLLLPSLLFWTSGISKDGMEWFLLGFCLWLSHRLSAKGFLFSRLAALLLGLGSLLLLRPYLSVLLLPGLLAWLVRGLGLKQGMAYLFPGSYLLLLGLGLWNPSGNPSGDLPRALIHRQSEFNALQGNSRLPPLNMEPTVAGLLGKLPQALDHALIRPYFSSWVHPLYLAMGFENLIMVGFLFFMFRNFKGRGFLENPLGWTCLLFAGLNLLVIGWTIPFLGAINRYRAIPLAMLLLVILSLTDWKFLKPIHNLFNSNKY